jgi:hypothetical protein
LADVIPAVIGDALALVEAVAPPLASHRIAFDRDATDSFVLALERLALPDGAREPIGTNVVGKDVGKDDLLPLLPRGSSWNPAVGWRSFVVIPFELPGVCAAAVGVEGVVPHASRGAFPVMRAFLMPAENVPVALSRLAAGLPGTGRGAEWLERRCFIQISDARTPAEHQQHEGPMLRAAAEAWGFGEKKLLRTLLLSDDQAPWPRRWRDKLRELAEDANPPSYLVATVPAIRAQFSRSTRLTLLRKEILG